MRLTRKSGAVLTVAVLIVAGGAGAALASSDDTEQPITGADLERASEAALAETGAGEVTETEVGDEESFYEVEVTMPDGSQVDVQLDEDFEVVGSESDQTDEDEASQDEADDG
jgi:hypothetical protein